MTLPLRAVAVRRPAPPDYTWDSSPDTYARTRLYQLMPHDIDPNAPAPRSFGESHDLWAEARDREPVEITNTVYWATAQVWDIDFNTGAFRVEADVSKGMSVYGEGIYQLTVFALHEGRPTIVSEYAFLVDG